MIDAHSPRSMRKRSIGAELAESFDAGGRPAPDHWKPHFSSTRRDGGLVTLAADLDGLRVGVGEDVVDHRAHGFGGVPLAPMLDA